jgi:hypothetical protein
MGTELHFHVSGFVSSQYGTVLWYTKPAPIAFAFG